MKQLIELSKKMDGKWNDALKESPSLREWTHLMEAFAKIVSPKDE